MYILVATADYEEEKDNGDDDDDDDDAKLCSKANAMYKIDPIHGA